VSLTIASPLTAWGSWLTTSKNGITKGLSAQIAGAMKKNMTRDYGLGGDKCLNQITARQI
jgi:hypothetical protein